MFRIISVPFEIPTDVVGNEDGDKLASYCAELVLRLVKSNDDVRKAVNYGEYVIVPPALSQAAVVVIATLHGLSGHFPKIVWQYRTEDGFSPIKLPVDVQRIREQARLGRDFGAALSVARQTCPKCGKIGPHQCEGE